MRKQSAPGDEVGRHPEGLTHPLADVAGELVEVIRGIKPKLDEGIKWNAPSFRHQGVDRVTLNLGAKDRVRVVLHCGAKAGPVRAQRLIDLETDMLEWAANDRAIMNFRSIQEVRAGKRELVTIIKQWLSATMPD